MCGGGVRTGYWLAVAITNHPMWCGFRVPRPYPASIPQFVEKTLDGLARLFSIRRQHRNRCAIAPVPGQHVKQLVLFAAGLHFTGRTRERPATPVEFQTEFTFWHIATGDMQNRRVRPALANENQRPVNCSGDAVCPGYAIVNIVRIGLA